MKKLLVIAALSSATVPSFGATVRIDGWTSAPALAWTSVSGVVPVLAGQFVGAVDGQSFKLFSADLKQLLALPKSDNYVLKSALDTELDWGARYGDVSKLFTSHYADVTSAKASAAFQLALWEILYEQKGAYDVNSGGLKVVADSGARRLANDWLGSLGSVQGYSIQRVYSGKLQDFLVATPVPEPATYALALAALGTLGVYAHRRRNRR